MLLQRAYCWQYKDSMNNTVYVAPRRPDSAEIAALLREKHRTYAEAIVGFEKDMEERRSTVMRYLACSRAIADLNIELIHYEVTAKGSIHFPAKTPIWKVADQLVALCSGILVIDLLKVMKHFGRDVTAQALQSAMNTHPECFRVVDTEGGKAIWSGDGALATPVPKVPRQPCR